MNDAARRAQQIGNHLQLAADLFRGSAGFGGPDISAQLEAKELAMYDLSKAVVAELNPNSPQAVESAALERAISSRLRSRDPFLGFGPGMVIPFSVLGRALTVVSASAGGNLVGSQTGREVGAFLRPGSATVMAGATLLTGLTADQVLPSFSAGATAGVVAENVAGNETDPAFRSVALSPKGLSCYVELSRKLEIQNPDVGGILAQELGLAVGQLIDRLAINGTGSNNEPLGLLNAEGIPTFSPAAANGLPTWAELVAMESLAIAAGGAQGSLAYVTDPKVQRLLLTTEKASGTGQFVWGRDGDGEHICGRRAYVSGNVPSNLVSGGNTGCSPLMFGNWQDLVIGIWGQGIEIIWDRHTYATTGKIRLVVVVHADIGVRRPGSFVLCKTLKTGY